MTVKNQGNLSNTPNLFTGLSTDTKPTTAQLKSEFAETDTGVWYRFNGSSWNKFAGPDSNDNDAGNVVVDGLANNAIIVNAANSPYTTTTTLGFRVLDKGTGSLAFTPNASGASSVAVTTAMLTDMGVTANNDFPVACSSLTAVGDTTILAYIP